MQSAKFAALDEYVRRQLEGSGMPGVALGVAREGRLLHGGGYGLRNVEQGLAPDLDTLFFIGALAKSFTCVAILRLQEEGRLAVHDPVVRYLPAFRMPDPAATAQVTLHHLMTHTAGIPRLALPPAADYGAFVDALSSQPYQPSGAPGEQFDYSDEGYALLGAVIEQVAGMPYQEFMTRHVAEPLGLSRTCFGPAVPEENLAVPYGLRRVEGARVFQPLDPAWAPGPYLPAGAGPRSTVRDLLRYLELFRQDGAPEGKRFLSEESMIYLTAGHALTPTPYAYGGGWFVQPEWHGVTLIDHGGGFTGSSAHLLFIPETGMTAVALTNRMMAPAENLALGAVWAAMGLPPGTPRYAEGAPSRNPDALAGEYRAADGSAYRVRAEGGRVWLGALGRERPARPVGGNAWAVTWLDGVERLFAPVFGEGGTVRGLLFWHQFAHRVTVH